MQWLCPLSVLKPTWSSAWWKSSWVHGPTPKIIAAVGDRAVLWGTDNGLEINNAGFEHSQPAPGSAKGFFLIFKIVSLECKVQTLERGRGWGNDIFHSKCYLIFFRKSYIGQCFH